MTEARGAGLASVSVVVPVGGVDEALQQQVAALAALDSPGIPTEYVLSLNSPDPVAARRLDALLAEVGDGRFRVVDSSAGRGAANARNVGALHATGEMLVFCDADDVVDAGWLRALVAASSIADAVGGRLDELVDRDDHRGLRPPATPDALPTFLGVEYIVSANLAIRASLFRQLGGFDTNLIRCEDTALSWKLLAAGHTLGFAPDAVVHYRSRGSLVGMMRQHYMYGRGMSQLLVRYGIPDVDGSSQVRGARLLRPNNQQGGRGGYVRFLRRASVATGRAVGLLHEKLRPGRAGADPRLIEAASP